MREHDLDQDLPRDRRRRRRFDDDEPRTSRRGRPAPRVDLDGRAGAVDRPPGGSRWSTWDTPEHGPEPRPRWVVTENAAVDTELGVLKTGKEADVHLLERGRAGDRPAHPARGQALPQRRAPAVPPRRRLPRGPPGPPIPGDAGHGHPDDVRPGAAAPHLAQLRPGPAELRALWHQLVDALLGLARHGVTHGDLSAYNLLVHNGRLVLIDLPQVVDVIANPQGPAFLERDVRRVADWFAARGLPSESGRGETLLAELRAELGLGGTATSQS